MPAAVQPERILRELAELWSGLARKENGASTESGVLRACAMTLIAAAEDETDAQQASEVVGELMHDHPSRAIVLKPSSAGELDARVFAQCWMPFGGRQQICCEQIEIAAAAERLGDVPVLMFALLAPDLPVVLWCRGRRWFGEPHFAELLSFVDKLIVDSESFSDPVEAFNLIAQLQGEGNRIADLLWSRLTGWREIIAQALQTPADLDRAHAGSTLIVEGGGPTGSAAALYLGAWLSNAFPDKHLVIQPSEDGKLRSVTLDGFSFRSNDGSVEVRSGDKVYTSVLTRCSVQSAMREELSIILRDTIYEQAFAIAHNLARRG